MGEERNKGRDAPPTVLVESEWLLKCREMRIWNRPGTRWLVFGGGLFSGGRNSRVLDRFQSRATRNGGCVSVLNFTDFFDEMVAAGEEALKVLEKKEEELRKSHTGRFLEKRLGSSRVFDGLRKEIAVSIRDRILFVRIAELFRGKYENLVVVRDGADIWGLNGAHLTMCHIDRRLQWQWMVATVRVIAHLALFVWRRGIRWRIGPSTDIDFAVPLVVGFERQKEAYRVPRTDDYLWDDHRFRPERILYVRHLWLRGRENREPLKKAVAYLRERGAAYADVRALPLNPRALGKLVSDVARFCRCIVRDLWSRKIDFPTAEAARRVLFEIFQEEVFFLHWAPKVYFSRDDYHPAHIVRTVLANQRGLKTIGIHHSTYLPQGLFPGMAFVYFNTYCVYGTGFARRFWFPTWMLSDHVRPVGNDQNDHTCVLVKGGEGEAVLRKRYPYRVILAWFPPGISAEMGMSEERIRDVAAAIKEVCETHRDVGVVVKPRAIAFPFYEKIVSQGVLGASAHILDPDLSTPYLMAGADVILASTISAIFVQAICAGKDRVISFDYWNWRDHPWRRYSPSFVVSDGRELRRRLGELITGMAIDRDGLAALRQDFDPFRDGRAVERFKAEVLELLDDVGRSSSVMAGGDMTRVGETA